MIIKHCTYAGIDALGQHRVSVIHPGIRSREKLGFPLLPHVEDFVQTLRPHPQYIFVLINALGASEFYGANVNADLFPEEALAHSGLTYGHRTFLRAGAYSHHANKDPSRSFGKILLSEWHPLMKRVELVVAIDRERAALFNGGRAVARLDSGQVCDVSMGSRVPFDTCTICLDVDRYNEAKKTFDPRIHRRVADAVLQFHRRNPIRGLAPTQQDYCECIRTKKGMILPDGRYVGMINDYPDFFDISFVFVGADRTAKTMWNIFPTHIENQVSPMHMRPEAKVAFENGIMEWETTPFIKAALCGGNTVEKTAETEKEGEIVKNVASTFANRLLPALEQQEPDIPEDVLQELASYGRNCALSSSAGAGIILKPREFSRITMICCRPSPLTDAMNVLSPGMQMPRITPDFIVPKLLSMLTRIMPHRSFHAPMLLRRMAMMRPAIGKSDNVGDDVLDKIGEVYQDYRQQVLDNVVPLVKRALDIESMQKLLPQDVTQPGALPVIYLLQAHQPPKKETSPALTDSAGLVDWIKEHPWLTASIVVPGMLTVRKHLALKK